MRTSHVLEGDPRKWVRAHQGCWEWAPVSEMVKGVGVQPTGRALTLYGRFAPSTEDDAAAGPLIYQGLRELASTALRSAPATTIAVRPPGRAVIPSEPSLVVEVELSLVTGPEPQPRFVAAVEEQLRALGFIRR
jgi:hypothetical protein